jgi:cell division protein FtsL
MAPLTAPARRAPLRKAPLRRPRPVRVPRAVEAPTPRGAALLDAILHGRIWIGIVFVLLAGIVFFNVDLLQMNRNIARTADHASAVKRENARLRSELARLGSSERIQTVAAERGLVLPAPAAVRYLKSQPTVDAAKAAKRLSTSQVPVTSGQGGAADGSVAPTTPTTP